MASLLSNDDDEPLESLFIKCEFNLNRILNADQRSDDEIILEIIRKFELCQKKIQIESLFSKNEEIDDVSTSSIKYLSLPIYLAKLHGQVTNLYQRKSHLLVSKQLYEEFLSICKNMRITNKEDLYDETPRNNDEARTMKIAKFRKEKETNARIALLEKQIDESGDGSGTTTDIEEEIRELSILRIQSRARFACDELGLIIQEIQLLDHMSDLRELEEEFGPSTGSGTGTGCTGNSRVPVAGLPSPPSSSSSMKESPGLTVTRTQNIDGQLVMTRETIKGSVFQPRMAGPTISVEQFGDMELRRMREQEAMAKERGAVEDGPVLKYNELCAEGKEDESDLVDKATYQDRAWDDWKDSVQKGSGNKMGKRF